MSECLFYLVFMEMTIMCNKCDSTEVEVSAPVVTVPATAFLAHWAGWKMESETHFRNNRMREFMQTMYKTDNNQWWHNTRKYRNGDHTINQRLGHDLAKRKATANKFASRDVVIPLDIKPIATYLQTLHSTNTRVSAKVEPRYDESRLKFAQGTWEELDVMNKLHPYVNNQGSTTEDYAKAQQAFVLFNTLHRVHLSTEDINQIAYYPTLKHMRDGREVRTRLGRYLFKYQHAFGLTDGDVKSMAEKHSANMQARGGWTVSFKEHDDEQGWLNVYESDDVSSCMRGMSAVRVYAHEKSVLRLAYVQAGEKIIARCIVRDDTEGKGWLRVYPDPNGCAEGRYLLDYLKSNGYENRTNLDGALLKYIATSSGSIVCPYLDSGENGGQSVSVVQRGDKQYLLAGGDDYSATDTGGYVENHEASCDCCGDSYHEDELNHIEHDGNNVCEYCRDQNYTYAYGRRHEDYFPEDECVRVGDDWYWKDTLDHHDIYMCDSDGEYYHMDDMTTTRDGMYNNSYVVSIDRAPDGEDWVFQDYVHELSDGTTCHQDDADMYQAEIDDAHAEMMAEANQA